VDYDFARMIGRPHADLDPALTPDPGTAVSIGATGDAAILERWERDGYIDVRMPDGTYQRWLTPPEGYGNAVLEDDECTAHLGPINGQWCSCRVCEEEDLHPYR
jgi:hypothetical protein